MDVSGDGSSLFSKYFRKKLAGIERANADSIVGHKPTVRAHVVGHPATHWPRVVQSRGQDSKPHHRNGSTVASCFTLEGFRPGDVICMRANMKCFGSERSDLTVNRTVRICRHMPSRWMQPNCLTLYSSRCWISYCTRLMDMPL